MNWSHVLLFLAVSVTADGRHVQHFRLSKEVTLDKHTIGSNENAEEPGSNPMQSFTDEPLEENLPRELNKYSDLQQSEDYPRRFNEADKFGGDTEDETYYRNIDKRDHHRHRHHGHHRHHSSEESDQMTTEVHPIFGQMGNEDFLEGILRTEDLATPRVSEVNKPRVRVNIEHRRHSGEHLHREHTRHHRHRHHGDNNIQSIEKEIEEDQIVPIGQLAPQEVTNNQIVPLMHPETNEVISNPVVPLIHSTSSNEENVPFIHPTLPSDERVSFINSVPNEFVNILGVPFIRPTAVNNERVPLTRPTSVNAERVPFVFPTLHRTSEEDVPAPLEPSQFGQYGPVVRDQFDYPMNPNLMITPALGQPIMQSIPEEPEDELLPPYLSPFENVYPGMQAVEPHWYY